MPVRRTLLVVLALLLGSPAQAAYFGKNKVRYRDFDWRVLETAHFEILFYDREAVVAEDAARLAEESYARLAGILQHEMSRRIPLILYASHSEFQQTNITSTFIDAGTGGITELLRRRVFLPFTGSYAELQHVLTHEMVHAFQLDILYDPTRTRDAVTPLAYSPPLWVMEGLAEYLSRSLPDPHTEMWLRDACLAGNLPSVEELGYAQDIRVYRFGQSVWEFFASEFGEETIGPFLIALRDQRSLDRALQQVAQLSLREFSERWRMAVRRRVLPGIVSQQAFAEIAHPVVTRRGESASLLLAPAVSPDGTQLAYVSDRRLNTELCVRAVEGAAGTRRLAEGQRSGDFESLRFFSANPAWSPDGRTVAFAAKAGGEDALYLWNAASGKLERKLAFGLDEVQTATFSPDGSELVFVGLAAGQSDLYRVRRDGTDLRRLTRDRTAERDPQWSPDGRSLVFVCDGLPDADFAALCRGRMRLELLDLETGRRRDITPFAAGKAISPAWSGDGEHLAFVSDYDGSSNIYVLHVPTGQVHRLTDVTTGVSGILPTSPALSWARQRDRLVFTAFTESGWDIYRLDDALASLKPAPTEPGLIAALEESSAAAAAAVAGSLAAAAIRGDGAQADEAGSDERLAAAGGGSPGLGAAIAPAMKVRDYRPRLSPDFSGAGAMIGYDTGFAGQSQLQFTDLLGDYTLTLGLGIYGSIKESDLYVSFLNRTARVNWSVAAFQFRRRYGVPGALSLGSSTSRQTYRGVQVGAIRPFDMFRRLEASVRVAGVEGQFFLGDAVVAPGVDPNAESMRTFVGPSLAYVVDSALYGYAGPMKGRRLRLAFDAGVGELTFATLEADLRQYWNLNRWYTLAARLYTVTSSGSSPQSAYLGGAQSLRGWDYGSLLGHHAVLASAEFRFPLVRHLALGWPLPLEFGFVEGVLFADGGSAWDDRWFRSSRAVDGGRSERAPLLSAGAGMRFNLGAIVLKLDWARLHDTGTGRRASGSSVALGTDF